MFLSFVPLPLVLSCRCVVCRVLGFRGLCVSVVLGFCGVCPGCWVFVGCVSGFGFLWGVSRGLGFCGVVCLGFWVFGGCVSRVLVLFCAISFFAKECSISSILCCLHRDISCAIVVIALLACVAFLLDPGFWSLIFH